MRIYLDLIFIENFIIDFALIFQTYMLAKQKRSITRYVIAAILGACYMVIAVYLKQSILNMFIIKIILSVCMVYTAFLPKKVLIFLKLIGLFYFMSFIYTGVITVLCQILNIKTNTFILTVIIYIIGNIITLIIVKYQKNIFKLNVLKKHLLYKISVNIGYNNFEYFGMVDTGNSVKDKIYGYNVVFVEKSDKLIIELENNNITKTKVIMNSINGRTEEDGYLIKDAKFEKKSGGYIVTEVVIVLVDKKLNKEGRFNAIIGINTYLDDLEGMLL